MTGLLGAFLRSLAFLTRLPSVPRAFSGEHPLGADAHAFPLAGLAIALPGALILVLLSALGLAAPVAALAAVAATIALTGALHEDGLGDVADGLGGHHERERALAIMKDSRVGTYGALALILAVLARVLLLAELLGHGAGTAALAFVAAAAASRGAMAWLWSALPSADPDGLAARVGQPDGWTGLLSLAFGVLVLLPLGAMVAGLPGLLLPLAACLLALALFRRFLLRRLGGQTGDALGATQQVTEIAVLLGFAFAV